MHRYNHLINISAKELQEDKRMKDEIRVSLDVFTATDHDPKDDEKYYNFYLQ